MAVPGLPEMNNTSLIESVYNTILSGQNGDLIRHISFQEMSTITILSGQNGGLIRHISFKK